MELMFLILCMMVASSPFISRSVPHVLLPVLSQHILTPQFPVNLMLQTSLYYIRRSHSKQDSQPYHLNLNSFFTNASSRITITRQFGPHVLYNNLLLQNCNLPSDNRFHIQQCPAHILPLNHTFRLTSLLFKNLRLILQCSPPAAYSFTRLTSKSQACLTSRSFTISILL